MFLAAMVFSEDRVGLLRPDLLLLSRVTGSLKVRQSPCSPPNFGIQQDTVTLKSNTGDA